jgi:glycosyltransferase involved in cell wall biosynthesis
VARIHVCLAGTWDRDFGRNVILQRLLERADFEVTTCRVDLWRERSVSVVRKGKARLFARALAAYPVLAWRFFRARGVDVVIVPYPGHFDMPVLGTIARLRGVPIIFDAFLSLFDTIVSDRALVGRHSPTALMARALDTISCRMANLVLVDTPQHGAFFVRLTGIPHEKYRTLWVGAREQLFRPRPDVTPDPDLVLFYGTFIPLQGVQTIVAAAKRVAAGGIRIRIIGDGQERATIGKLAADLGITNIEWEGMIPLEQLPGEIARATICLGIFGTTGKADRVIPNKLYESIAVGRAVITGDTTAVRNAFESNEIVMVPVGDPERLAQAILMLHGDAVLRDRTRTAGHQRYQDDYSEASLSRLLRTHIEDLVNARRARATR